MKKELKGREGERLCDWCDRLAVYIAANKCGIKELKEILREVSVSSYIHGSVDSRKIDK